MDRAATSKSDKNGRKKDMAEEINLFKDFIYEESMRTKDIRKEKETKEVISLHADFSHPHVKPTDRLFRKYT